MESAARALDLLGVPEQRRAQWLARLQPPTLRATDLTASVELALLLPVPGKEASQLDWAYSWPLQDLEEARRQLQSLGFDLKPAGPGRYRARVSDEVGDALLTAAPAQSEPLRTLPEPASDLTLAVEPQQDAVSTPSQEPTPDAESAPVQDEAPGGDAAPEEASPKKFTYCELGEAVGQVPARLVCASSEDAREQLAPWLRRTLPRAAAPKADLEAELRLSTAWDQWGSWVRAKAAMAGAAGSLWLLTEGVESAELRALPAQAMMEALALAQDLDKLVVAITLDPTQRSATSEVTVTLRSRHSWVAQWAADQVNGAGPAPETLWRLPDGATRFGFGRTGTREQLAPLARTLGELSAWGIGQLEASPRVAAEVRELVEGFFSLSGSYLWAHGAVPEPPRDAAGGSVKGLARAALDAYVGWTFIELSGPASQSTQWLAHLQNLVELIRKGEASEGGTEAMLEFTKGLHLSWNDAPAGCPAGSTLVDLTWSKPRTEEDGPEAATDLDLELQLAVIPKASGGHWLAVSANPEYLTKLVSGLQGKGDWVPLSKKAGLDALRAPRLVSADVTVLSDYGTQLLQLAPEVKSPEVDDWVRLLTSLPHALATPIVSTVTGEEQGERTSLHVRTVIARESLEDLGVVLRFLEARSEGSQESEVTAPQVEEPADDSGEQSPPSDDGA